MKKEAQAMGRAMADGFISELLRMSPADTSTVEGAAQGYDGLVHEVHSGQILVGSSNTSRHYYMACRLPEPEGGELVVNINRPRLVNAPVTCLKCLAVGRPR